MGSSPRVRGKRLPGHPLPIEGGLIPACAGKTGDCADVHGAARAHPRVCGENGRARALRRASAGSSPRVRGKPGVDAPCVGQRRLIPACAGKTSAAPCHVLADGGSSPRVRGKRDGLHLAGRGSGLIPACAGKTERAWSVTRRRRAHPRVCGENGPSRTVGLPGEGSSPRVRGKPGPRGPPRRPGGLIPACAGKTTHCACCLCRWRAHPRVCGENAQ